MSALKKRLLAIADNDLTYQVDIGTVREAVSRITALEAENARLVAAQAWQPIETAPKDGSRFLFTNGDMVGIAFYMHRIFAADSWHGAVNTNPTHWMPLPAPPGPTP